MDILSGVKRLTNRKRAQPASSTKKPSRVELRPEVQPSDLPTPVFGADPNLLKEFSALPEEDKYGISVTYREKDIISVKSLKQRKELPEFEILDISYSIISNEELEKIAVFEARNTEDDGLYSVNDPRNGTVDNHVMCSTCNLDNLECPGHVGIIKLNEAILHPLFRREIVDILVSICGSCGGLLLPYDTIKEKGFLNLSGSKRLREIAEASKGLPCRRNLMEEGKYGKDDRGDREEGITKCIPNPIYQTSKLKETGMIYYTREKKSKTSDNVRTVQEVATILESISKEDAAILGFTGESHPSRFIMRSLPVIPLCARAPVMQDGMLVKDDLTSIYKDIIRYNNELGKDLPEDERSKKIKNLIFSIEHMINNSDKKYGQGKKKIYKSLLDRVQGKEGLIREAIMGKRVNFSARSVLGPDPTLRFGQIRVPKVMAPYLTQHEIITPENLRKMTTLLRSGRITYITPSTGKAAGKRIKVTQKIQKEHTFVIGDEIDRWLENGDWVVFNRQPTLHKQGIMGYEVVLGDPLTIGMHLGYTRQHNAD